MIPRPRARERASTPRHPPGKSGSDDLREVNGWAESPQAATHNRHPTSTATCPDRSVTPSNITPARVDTAAPSTDITAAIRTRSRASSPWVRAVPVTTKTQQAQASNPAASARVSGRLELRCRHTRRMSAPRSGTTRIHSRDEPPRDERCRDAAERGGGDHHPGHARRQPKNFQTDRGHRHAQHRQQRHGEHRSRNVPTFPALERHQEPRQTPTTPRSRSGLNRCHDHVAPSQGCH